MYIYKNRMSSCSPIFFTCFFHNFKLPNSPFPTLATTLNLFLPRYFYILSSLRMACKNLNCRSFRRNIKLVISLMTLGFFIMVPTLSPSQFMAQGRQLGALNAAASWRNEVRMSRRIVIGSKPPRCNERCKNCGKCKAVQVPIVPIKKALQKYYKKASTNNIPRFPYSRGDDISNYKPMCWKCKCGDFLFNPW